MLKIIAILSMVTDHIGTVFFPSNQWLHIIGRLAFPLFAGGVAIGFRRSSNPKRYAGRLLLLGIISQVPHFLLFQSKYLNVCFTLFAGIVILMILNTKINHIVKYASVISIFILAHVARVEYGVYGLLTIVVFFYFQNIWSSLVLHTASIMIGMILYHYSFIQLFALISIFIVIYLRQYDFRLNKQFSYGFYPAHLVLLLFFNNICG
ncbi:TraX family protein [Brevibacillus agri]|uniref:TraX family protein n=1 Tax=Brevibacillus agri TaxID=51101 RepID=UPI00047242E2|nr:TraX family protein [Brevibacillus agri]MED1642466.1 TraX family protein [Brevibacillus agri]MED1654875.1 TraX family protein [Brevibacillus agri]MED1689784.1 TraX family protein [Brevibacillus agri]MED1694364.1 TraX family protein [Brevibacillus agri]MED1700384.1 TraX family protein [Brevibacillus agri]